MFTIEANVIEPSRAAPRPSGAGEPAPWHKNFNREFLISCAGILSFFFIWHLVATSGHIDPVMLTPPGEVFRSAIALAKTRELYGHVQASILRIVTGYALGSTVGIAAGVVLGRSRFLEAFLGPILQMARAIPPLQAHHRLGRQRPRHQRPSMAVHRRGAAQRSPLLRHRPSPEPHR